MKHYFGLNEYMLRQQGREQPVQYIPSQLINAHLMLCGMSGVGKSHQLKRLLNSASRCGVGIDVFDVHEELHDIHGARAVKYSQSTGYGFNPLVLDLDPHSGGVNRQADFLVGLIRQVTTQFGSKQEAALRNLIVDVYAAKGIFPENARSWARKNISEAERKRLIEQRQFQQLREYYPTLGDLLEYAERKVLTMLFGGDNKAMNALEALAKLNQRLQAQNMKFNKTRDVEAERAKLEEQIQRQEDKCIEAYSEAVKAKPARECASLIKYDSKDVLISVVQRLQILASSGIFNANAPDFGGSSVRVHQIKSLSDDQQVLFVKLRLREIFDECKRLGPTPTGTEVRRVVVLEEAPKYFTEDKDDVVNVIAREARKFGLGLWCAAQSPTAFPQDFVTNCGAKILLGIDASFWKGTMAKMRISEDGLKYIKAKEVISVKLHREGQSDPPFTNVVVPNPGSEAGRKAAAQAA